MGSRQLQQAQPESWPSSRCALRMEHLQWNAVPLDQFLAEVEEGQILALRIVQEIDLVNEMILGTPSCPLFGLG